MTRAQLQKTALKLPPQERQELVEVLWKSLEDEPEPLLEWQRELLDERLDHLEKHPEEGIPWEQAMKEIWPEQK